jgi:hypothetical protein
LAPNIDLSFTTASTPIGGLNNGQPVIFPATGAVIATGIVLTASSRLLVDTWDAEATFATQWGNCGFLISGGGRYLHTAQIYEATAPGMFVTIPGAPGVRTFTDASVLSRRTFTGGGPTVALDALHRLGQSHLSLFGSGRASLLYGCSRQSIETTRFQILETPTVSLQQTSISNVSNSGSRLLSVLELELGLEWTRPIGRGAEFVFRPAAVAQLYLDGGNASSNSGNFGLYGGMLSGGFRY